MYNFTVFGWMTKCNKFIGWFMFWGRKIIQHASLIENIWCTSYLCFQKSTQGQNDTYIHNKKTHQPIRLVIHWCDWSEQFCCQWNLYIAQCRWNIKKPLNSYWKYVNVKDGSVSRSKLAIKCLELCLNSMPSNA